jgi:hypothetical protein
MATPVRDAAGQSDVAVLLGTADMSADGLLDHLQPGAWARPAAFSWSRREDRLFVASTDAAMSLTPTPPEGVNLLHDRAMTGFRGSGTDAQRQGHRRDLRHRIRAQQRLVHRGAPARGAKRWRRWHACRRFILEQRAPAVATVLVAHRPGHGLAAATAAARCQPGRQHDPR